jgi:uncharacterized protein YjbI with pentapeptide repeats
MTIVYRGPRPYSELDEENFFGRIRETDEIVELIERNRLSIVTAPSGVGKTSVLLAGVVPRLRRVHEEELLHDNKILGPTLVCRNWAGSTRRPAHRVLLDAVNVGVRDLTEGETLFLKPSESHALLEDKLRQEAVDLRAIIDPYLMIEPRDLDWLDVMSACADKVGRLVLLFDQFEDALRLPPEGTKKVLRTISNLFHQESRVRVLLSFRQEYVMSLHELEVSVGGLVKRTYYLQAIKPADIDVIVKGPASKLQIDVKDGVVIMLQDWLQKAQTAQEEAADDFSSRSGDALDEDDESVPVPLLALQALLVDIFEVVVEGKQKQEITLDDLAQYAVKRQVEEKNLAQKALENHIEKVVAQPADEDTSAELKKLAKGASTDEQNLLLRRLFARMPSQLTSGSRPGAPGYKKQIGLRKLLEEVLKDDFDALNVSFKATQTDDLLAFVKDPTSVAVDFKRSQERRSEQNPRSGVARRIGWTDARATQVLVASLAELLKRLVKGNVLKPLGSGGEAAYELVHDGLGPAVQAWAEKFQTKPDDALASVTRLNGATFRWPPRAVAADTKIDNVFWSGCVITGQEFTGVTFRQCKLTGTMFHDCSFRGANFEDCDLDGAIFQESKFFARNHNEQTIPVTFRGGQMQSALFKGCQFHDAVIDGVALNGTVFVLNDFFGRLLIENSSLEVVVFRDCLHRNEKGDPASETGIFVSKCDFVFSRIIGGSGAETSVFLDPHDNLLFPEDPDLFNKDPGHRHWKRRPATA